VGARGAASGGSQRGGAYVASTSVASMAAKAGGVASGGLYRAVSGVTGGVAGGIASAGRFMSWATGMSSDGGGGGGGGRDSGGGGSGHGSVGGATAGEVWLSEDGEYRESRFWPTLAAVGRAEGALPCRDLPVGVRYYGVGGVRVVKRSDGGVVAQRPVAR
jgi:hypothetical protein